MDQIQQIDVTFETEEATAKDMCLALIGPNLFRVEEAPIFVESVSYGDIIEAYRQDDGSLLFRQVVKKSDLKSYQFILPTEIITSDNILTLLDKITSIGGHWERLFGGCLFIYIPANIDYDPTDEINRVVIK